MFITPLSTMSTPPLLCDGDGLAMPAKLRSLVMAQKPEIKIT